MKEKKFKLYRYFVSFQAQGGAFGNLHYSSEKKWNMNTKQIVEDHISSGLHGRKVSIVFFKRIKEE